MPTTIDITPQASGSCNRHAEDWSPLGSVTLKPRYLVPIAAHSPSCWEQLAARPLLNGPLVRECTTLVAKRLDWEGVDYQYHASVPLETVPRATFDILVLAGVELEPLPVVSKGGGCPEDIDAGTGRPV